MQATLSSLVAFMPHIFKSAHLINRALFIPDQMALLTNQKALRMWLLYPCR